MGSATDIDSITTTVNIAYLSSSAYRTNTPGHLDAWFAAQYSQPNRYLRNGGEIAGWDFK